MNLKTGQVVIGISDFYIRFSDRKNRTRTKLLDASVEGYDGVTLFPQSDDLIGRHILYRYTTRDTYEHIHLNRSTSTWHCLSGTQKGLADTEPCKLLKLAENLYLLLWSEKMMPVESIVVVDLDRMRSAGRSFCRDLKPAKPVQMMFGSYACVLAETDAAGVVARQQETKGCCAGGRPWPGPSHACHTRSLAHRVALMEVLCKGAVGTEHSPLLPILLVSSLFFLVLLEDGEERLLSEPLNVVHGAPACLITRLPTREKASSRARLKCDEKIPSCTPCEKTELDCPGYKRDVRWSSKHEILQPKTSNSQVQRRLSRDAWFVDCATRLQDAIVMTRTARGIASRTAQPNLVYMESTTDKHLRYYFSHVCGILSAYDSPTNPFRSLVKDLIHQGSYPALLKSVLAMSAAHLYQDDKDRIRHSLEPRTQAISSLASQISALDLADDETEVVSLHKRGKFGPDSSSSTTALLLSAVNLGMTSTWHEVFSLDLIHLPGSRALFKRWISDTNLHSGSAGPAPRHPQADFLSGMMAMFECLSSFHVDQDLAAVDYLWPFCGYPETTTRNKYRPNPLTGVSAELFIYMAKVGTISRQLDVVNRVRTLSIPGTYEGEGDLMYHSLLQKAREIEASVRAYTPPSIHRMQETGDELTPLAHFYIMGQVYQLAVLLELYRMFPETTENQNEPPNPDRNHSPPHTKHRHLLVSLAINILTLLCSIPRTSRTKAMQMIPVAIAASALQGVPDPQISTQYPNLNQTVECLTLHSTTSTTIIKYWRTRAMETIAGIRYYVGLESADVVKRVVEGVWLRADSRVMSAGAAAPLVSWTDVMREENLQTLFCQFVAHGLVI
ncbi:uncharacterized protein DSM5745_03620 [Aspergillus mulundensis]|uniref:Uncharacterized protein n=1 Tax=Aspergillus mulundensis TaxID=1810919 RepID=A0A3D8SME9_9EURO|nr:hypothetical protein DSM5745_03620 [Aspergillus mulundensis]RDW86978.1 hypothetical protein DSM5745_03620 [Aspergillus mulundensis]